MLLKLPDLFTMFLDSATSLINSFITSTMPASDRRWLTPAAALAIRSPHHRHVHGLHHPLPLQLAGKTKSVARLAYMERLVKLESEDVPIKCTTCYLKHGITSTQDKESIDDIWFFILQTKGCFRNNKNRYRGFWLRQ